MAKKTQSLSDEVFAEPPRGPSNWLTDIPPALLTDLKRLRTEVQTGKRAEFSLQEIWKRTCEALRARGLKRTPGRTQFTDWLRGKDE